MSLLPISPARTGQTPTFWHEAVVNGILWTAHMDIPEKGAPIAVTPKDMELPPEEPKKK